MADRDCWRRRHLNRDGVWRDFERRGLRLDPHGALELVTLPGLRGVAPATLVGLPEPDGPAGLAIGPDGIMYLTQPASHQVLVTRECETEPRPLVCAGGEGAGPTQCSSPRGILFHPGRGAVLVADTGNNRIQVFDAGTQQLVGIWGQPAGSTAPGAEPGRLDRPTSLAGDPDGFVYVVDEGNQRVQKFSAAGVVAPDFWERLKTEATFDPLAIVVAAADPVIEIWILDRGGRLVVADPDGRLLYLLTLSNVERPMGLAVDRDAIYVGDNARRRLLTYDSDGRYLGEAQGYEGPIANLAVDGEGGLIVHPGVLPVVPLSTDGARVRRGFMWGGPFLNKSPRDEQWHQITAVASGLSADARVQLFVHSTTSTGAPPVDEASPDPFSAGWTAVPLDAPAAVVRGKPFDKVWMGLQLTGDGATTPALHDIRLDFDHRSYLHDLPAVFREDAASRDFLVRLLALMQTAMTDAEEQIDRLPELFDSEAVPPAWLPWLASWLAFDLDTNGAESQQRAALARAFEASAWRGTNHGLSQTLRFLTGLELHVAEPVLDAGWWALATDGQTAAAADASILGCTTRLVAGEPQGAVLDTTAVLDGSHLTTTEDFGAALFDDVAHQFTVNVYRGPAFSEDRLTLVRRLIEREKPAHTRYELCVVEPLMRVGFQARIGIDSIVARAAGPDRPARARRRPDSGEPARIGRALQVGNAFSG